MKKTLLEIVQSILSDMDSDEVNSIADTVESLQVASLVQSAYENLTATLNIPERERLLHLEALSDTGSPNYLKVPDNVKSLSWLRYNGTEVNYIDKDQFFQFILDNQTDNYVVVTDPDGTVEYNIQSDADPIWYTSVDDTYLVFNSFNIVTDTTLQAHKSMAFCQLNPIWEMTDEFVPDLDANFFPTLIAEAKSMCFVDLKQVSNSKSEVQSRRGLVRIQNDISKTKRSPLDRLPNYGRSR